MLAGRRLRGVHRKVHLVAAWRGDRGELRRDVFPHATGFAPVGIAAVAKTLRTGGIPVKPAGIRRGNQKTVRDARPRISNPRHRGLGGGCKSAVPG